MLPSAVIVFLVTGLILVGVATPSEAAATGCLGALILTIAYRRFSWRVLKSSVKQTLKISAMILIIMGSAAAYSQILAFSGASAGLINFVVNVNVPPIVAVIFIQGLLALMGLFMHTTGNLMIILPLFVPIVNSLGLDPVWFAAITLLNCEIASVTPPFGSLLFVMQGVSPGTNFSDIVRAALPFIGMSFLVMVLMLAFPVLTTWLPDLLFN